MLGKAAQKYVLFTKRFAAPSNMCHSVKNKYVKTEFFIAMEVIVNSLRRFFFINNYPTRIGANRAWLFLKESVLN